MGDLIIIYFNMHVEMKFLFKYVFCFLNKYLKCVTYFLGGWVENGSNEFVVHMKFVVI